MAARVQSLRSIHLATTDLARAKAFFTEVWRLEAVSEEADGLQLRGTARYHDILSLKVAPRAAVIRVVLDGGDRAGVDGLYDQVRKAGQPTDAPPRALTWPGGGYGFGCKDPEGRNFAVVCDIADHGSGPDRPDRPRRLSHVNLNCADNERTFAFMRDAFGFALSDHANNFRFIRCNSDHHSMVIGFNDSATLNHIAFEMPELDSVMRGIGRMRDHGYPVEWGPGRHGPGNNVFAYFCGPEEFPLEYTGEMQQVNDSYRVGGPDDWKWPPGRVDQWGITPGPTARVKRAQKLFRFTEDGHRLDE